MSIDKPFTKKNLDDYLKELSKEFRKKNGTKVPAEIILVGGASILINYGFRETTYDLDAIIKASGAMKDAITVVGDKFDLPTGWINTDFVNTASYTPRLSEYSKYYRTFSNILQVRTISASYLIAMKLMAGRQYKNDLSDIIGVLIEHEKRDEIITLDDVKKAIVDLYDSYANIPEHSRRFIEAVYTKDDLNVYYEQCREFEKDNKDTLLDFQTDYPGVLNRDNVEDVLKAIKKKSSSMDFFKISSRV